jgi:predicted amidohydrolase
MVRPRPRTVIVTLAVAATLMALAGAALAAPPGRVRLSAASLPWDAEARTLDAALAAIERAAADGADLVALPQECVPTKGEPIPGPVFNELAHEAFRWGIYVVGCLREREGDKTYLTGFLIDPRGELVGKYRKSHRLPHEDMDLGDELPVLKTEFGTIGITIGTDHFFPEIDQVLAAKGAGTIIWCTAPWPWRNEYPIDIVLRGRARDFSINYVVSRYYGIKGYGGYDTSYSGYTARWPIGRAYVIQRRGLVVASTGYDGGVATAIMNASDVAARGRAPSGYLAKGLYNEIGAPTPPPNDTQYAQRRIKVAVVEAESDFDRLLGKLDLAGQMGADIVGNWEYVWSTKLEPAECERRLAAIGEVAARHQMYLVFGGYLDRPHHNDGLIWDRSGQVIGRFTKIHVTTFGKTVGQIAGTECPVFETDFGRHQDLRR